MLTDLWATNSCGTKFSFTDSCRNIDLFVTFHSHLIYSDNTLSHLQGANQYKQMLVVNAPFKHFN